MFDGAAPSAILARLIRDELYLRDGMNWIGSSCLAGAWRREREKAAPGVGAAPGLAAAIGLVP
jgi:hypothetical protein